MHVQKMRSYKKRWPWPKGRSSGKSQFVQSRSLQRQFVQIEPLLAPRDISLREAVSQTALALLFCVLIVALEVLLLATVSAAF